MSEAMTRGIRVKVESEFVPERSDPHNGEFFFAYHVTIENHGSEPVRLLSRHWVITVSPLDPNRIDARQLPHGDGRRRDVRSRDRSLHAGDPRRAQLTSVRLPA